jgi:hypothetical protein
MSKYKALRPEDKWQREQDKSSQPTEKKKRDRSSKAKKSQSSNQTIPTSEAYFQSDALGPSFFQSDAPAPFNQGSPHDQDLQPQEANTVTELQQTESYQKQRASSVRPAKRLKSVTSNAASAALSRAIQSSPARWLGTRHSPIELEEDFGSTRRLLFPSPRKGESNDVLGEVATNTVQSAVSFHSPHTRGKDQAVETADKENHPPPSLFDEEDDDIIKLFEDELARPSRPTTPVQKSQANNHFKTPTRPTPNHRPVTRSISKSAQSSHKLQMLPQRTPTRTPSTGRRRSPRHNVLESPFTATLNKLLSEGNDEEAANHSPSRHLDFGLDFSALPDLGHSGAHDMRSDVLNFQMAGFDPNHDFFSTDIPMPSSPPRLFNLYEDPLTMGIDGMGSSIWNDFSMDDSAIQAMGICDSNANSMYNTGPIGADEVGNTKAEVKDSGGDVAEQGT